MRLILHTTTVVDQIISNLWRALDQPTSAIRPRAPGKLQEAMDSPTATCDSWAHTQILLTRRKASVPTAADMRTARSCSTRQAVLAAMREFPPNPTLLGLLNNYSKKVGPQLLFSLHRVKIPIFVAWFDDLAALCLFSLVCSRAERRRRRTSSIFLIMIRGGFSWQRHGG
jgi:hypothetical protein